MLFMETVCSADLRFNLTALLSMFLPYKRNFLFNNQPLLQISHADHTLCTELQSNLSIRPLSITFIRQGHSRCWSQSQLTLGAEFIPYRPSIYCRANTERNNPSHSHLHVLYRRLNADRKPDRHIIGLWEETSIPRGNPHQFAQSQNQEFKRILPKLLLEEKFRNNQNKYN